MREKLRENKPPSDDRCPDSEQSVLISGSVENLILIIRGRKVILDADLARLYGVSTKGLNQAVKRNSKRFPPDFMFRLSKAEKEEVVTNCDHLRNIKYSNRLPHAFTEHGAIMAATVLNSPQAMDVSLYVVRAFVHLRTVVSTQGEILDRLEMLERKLGTHDKAIVAIFDAIRSLMTPPACDKRKIGFDLKEKGDEYD